MGQILHQIWWKTDKNDEFCIAVTDPDLPNMKTDLKNDLLLKNADKKVKTCKTYQISPSKT